VAGNDFGNRVARMFAASHPELTRSVILLAAGGKIQGTPDAQRALQVIFNPKSTEADILAVMKYLVANPADSARVWAIFKRSLDPRAAAIEAAAAQATPLATWWAPPGQTKYTAGSERSDRASRKWRGAAEGTGRACDVGQRPGSGASPAVGTARDRGGAHDQIHPAG
jgi:pimeloyl-ACP methyl ester carboxylesterase